MKMNIQTKWVFKVSFKASFEIWVSWNYTPHKNNCRAKWSHPYLWKSARAAFSDSNFCGDYILRYLIIYSSSTIHIIWSETRFKFSRIHLVPLVYFLKRRFAVKIQEISREECFWRPFYNQFGHDYLMLHISP